MFRLYLWFGSIAFASCWLPVAARPRSIRAVQLRACAHFTLETFNVEAGKEHDRATVAAVGAADADVVCWKKPAASWPDSLRAAYRDRYPYQLYKADPSGHPSGAFAILSRYPVTDLGVLSGSHDWHWHPAWRVQVETPGAKLQLLLVHLRAMFNGEFERGLFVPEGRRRSPDRNQ